MAKINSIHAKMRAEDLFQNLRKEVEEIINRHPTISPDNAFVAWFLHAYIVEDETKAIEALKGGPCDKGIDAVYIDHDARRIFLVQGKYHQGDSAPATHREDIITLADLGRVLMLDEAMGFKSILEGCDVTVSEALKEARNKIHRDNYRLNLQFVTTGKISTIHLQEAEQRISDWKSANYEGFGREHLLRFMHDYLEGAAPPTPLITLPIEEQETFKRHDDDTGITSWIFTMKGSRVADVFKDVGIRLFARNIRGFLGNTDINKGMRTTIVKEPEYFWYFNNGITIVCDKARRITEGGTNQIKITNAQIINGQQTTRSLAMQEDNNAEVLIKLIEIPRESSDSRSQYKRIVNQIVSSTNSQNAIAPSDLKSNDQEQVRIERDFRKLGYHYLRKKMSKSESRLKMARSRGRINKDDIARFIGACILDPYEVRLGKNRLFEDDLYSKIFDEMRPVAEYLLIYWFCRLVFFWSRKDSRRRYAKWHVLHFLWSKLGRELMKPRIRDTFLYIAERSGSEKYKQNIDPLNRLADKIFVWALAFHRENKWDGDKLLNEQDYFKHKNLHKKFEEFWKKQSPKKHKYLDKKVSLFLQRLEAVEK